MRFAGSGKAASGKGTEAMKQLQVQIQNVVTQNTKIGAQLNAVQRAQAEQNYLAEMRRRASMGGDVTGSERIGMPAVLGKKYHGVHAPTSGKACTFHNTKTGCRFGTQCKDEHVNLPSKTV